MEKLGGLNVLTRDLIKESKRLRVRKAGVRMEARLQ